MSKTKMMLHLSILIAAIAIAGLSNPDDAPQDAVEMWQEIVNRNCTDPDHATERETVIVFRAVLKKAEMLTDGVAERLKP